MLFVLGKRLQNRRGLPGIRGLDVGYRRVQVFVAQLLLDEIRLLACLGPSGGTAAAQALCRKIFRLNIRQTRIRYHSLYQVLNRLSGHDAWTQPADRTLCLHIE